MAVVKRSALLAFSAEQMYALVEGVEDYPSFLPWCEDVDVQRDESAGEVLAILMLNYHGLKYSFSTRNQNEAGRSITMRLVDGPFKKLEGGWLFKPLGDVGCKVEFELEYDFSNPVLAKLMGAAFEKVTSSFVEAFHKRAEEIYGNAD